MLKSYRERALCSKAALRRCTRCSACDSIIALAAGPCFLPGREALERWGSLLQPANPRPASLLKTPEMSLWLSWGKFLRGPGLGQ